MQVQSEQGAAPRGRTKIVGTAATAGTAVSPATGTPTWTSTWTPTWTSTWTSTRAST